MNGKKYSEWSEHYDPEKNEIEILKKHGVSFRGKTVLEVGCGTGRFTRRIIRDCESLIALDPDENALTVLNALIVDPKLLVIKGTLDTISLGESLFDYVVFPWSMYLIPNKRQNIKIAFDHLKMNGKLIVLQANSGEYEEEISKLYSKYDSLKAYESGYDNLGQEILEVFGNVETDTLCAFFYFDSIEDVVDNSLFFIEDEEGIAPNENKVNCFRESLKKYIQPSGVLKMSDTVSVFIATKKGDG